ncbi:MAG: CHAT domain-containing tetratricopeptide repeat protein [Bacteroidota bacterium]
MKTIFSLLVFWCLLFSFNTLAAQEELVEVDTALARQYLEEGKKLVKKKQFEAAITEQKKALAIIENSFGKQHPRTALAHKDIALTYELRGDFQKAIDHYLTGSNIQIYNLGEKSIEVSDTYQDIGATYEYLSKIDEAIKYKKKSLAIRLAILPKMHIKVSHAYNNLGYALYLNGEYHQAKKNYEYGLYIKQNLFEENHPELTICFKNIANTYSALSMPDSAIFYFNLALESSLAYHERPTLGVARLYQDLGAYYYTIGHYKNAQQFTQKSLDISIEYLGSMHPDVGDVLTNMGAIHFATSEYENAFKAMSKSLMIQIDKLGSEKNYRIAGLYMSLSTILLATNKDEPAIELCKKALKIYKETLGNSHPAIALCYSQLGRTFLKLKNYSSAYNYFQKSLRIRTENLGENHIDVGQSYYQLGTYFLEQDSINSAISFLEKALSIHKGINEEGITALMPSIYQFLAHAYSLQQNHQTADSIYFEALKSTGYQERASFDNISLITELIDILKFHSNFYRELYHQSKLKENLYKSYLQGNQALSATNYQFKEISPSSQAVKSQYAKTIYEMMVLTNNLLYQTTDSSHYQTEAFTFAERSKALLLYQAMQESQALQYAGIPDSLLQKEYDLRVNISYYDQKRQEAFSRGLVETDSMVLDISSTLFDLNQTYDSLKTLFETQYPQYYQLKYDLSTVDVAEVQQSLLASDQTMLEYFVGDSSIFVFTINQEDYEIVEIKKDFPLNEWVDQMRKGMYAQFGEVQGADSLYANSTYSANQYAEAAFQLYDKLLAPVAPKLKQRVLIIPDGVLGYIPFQALLTKPPQKAYRYHQHAYFGSDHPISYSYSATLWKEMRQKEHQQKPQKSVLAVAPYYDGTLYTLDSLYLEELEALGIQEDLQTRTAFAPLKYSGEEAFFASELWEGDYLDQAAATEAQFMQRAKDYRILHLATHGEANDQIGEYAFLAFTEIPDSLENELLYVKDIYNLSLNADLVILSACQTGTGELQRGEGIISLARAFAYAGAKSIITTLWNVNDAKTKDVMNSFHLNLKQGNTKDVALWKAQKEYLKKHKGALANPFYWAPFIGVGDMGRLGASN